MISLYPILIRNKKKEKEGINRGRKRVKREGKRKRRKEGRKELIEEEKG